MLIPSFYVTSPRTRSPRPVRVPSDQNTRWQLPFHFLPIKDNIFLYPHKYGYIYIVDLWKWKQLYNFRRDAAHVRQGFFLWSFRYCERKEKEGGREYKVEKSNGKDKVFLRLSKAKTNRDCLSVFASFPTTKFAKQRRGKEEKPKLKPIEKKGRRHRAKRKRQTQIVACVKVQVKFNSLEQWPAKAFVRKLMHAFVPSRVTGLGSWLG